MIPARRLVALALILVAAPALAGCNVSLWTHGQGVVNIWIEPQPPSGSALNDFSTLKIGVIGVAVIQGESLQPQNFMFAGDPKVVDMLHGGSPQPVKVVSTTMSLRAITSLTVRIEGVEAIRASGATLQFCYPGQKDVVEPCVSIPQNGAYTVRNHPISISRGGTVDVYFPLSVQYDQPHNEYFIQGETAAVQLHETVE